MYALTQAGIYPLVRSLIEILESLITDTNISYELAGDCCRLAKGLLRPFCHGESEFDRQGYDTLVASHEPLSPEELALMREALADESWRGLSELSWEYHRLASIVGVGDVEYHRRWADEFGRDQEKRVLKTLAIT